MLKCMVENVTEEVMMRLNGDQYVAIDPRSWNSSMDLSINVGLGTGQEAEKMAALNQALGLQMQVFQTYGAGNGMVSLTNIRNTLADMLAIQGVRNADRYFMPMNPQLEQQMMAQQQQAQGQQQADPNAAFLQAEQMKMQAKMAMDQQKLQLEMQKAMAADDLKRDQMDQELLISAAEILGKYGTAVDLERIKQMQNEPRFQ